MWPWASRCHRYPTRLPYVWPLDRRRRQRQLDTAVADLTGVHHGAAVAGRARDGDWQNLIGRGLLIDRRVDSQFVTEEAEIGPDLFTGRLLGLQARVGKTARRSKARQAGPC